MSVHIQYIGRTGSITGKKEETLHATGRLSTLLVLLKERYPGLEECSFITARNDQILHEDFSLKDGDRISLIPPAPGG